MIDNSLRSQDDSGSSDQDDSDQDDSDKMIVTVVSKTSLLDLI